MLTSAARDTLRNVEAVIVDEIHALAPQARRAPGAGLERLERWSTAARPTHRPVGHRPAARGGRGLPRRGPAGAPSPPPARKPLDIDRGPGRGHGSPGSWSTRPPKLRRPGPRGAIWPSSIHACSSWSRSTGPLSSSSTPAAWPSDWPPASTSSPPRARTGPRGHRPPHSPAARPGPTARARPEVVKAHHGSLSRRAGPDRGRAQARRAQGPGGHQLARARHRHGCGRPGRPGRRRPRCRGASSASAGPATRSASRAGASSSPSTATTWSRRRWWRSACSDGLIEHTRYPRNPLDVLAQQIVAMCALDEWPVDELERPGPPGRALRRAERRGPDQRARPAGRPLPLRRVRRAAAPPRVGPRHGTARGRRGRAAPGRDQRRHHPRPRALRRVPARPGPGPPGRRARRGDGLREPGGRAFLLGASTWRIEDITHERVVVSPAPGQPGKMPFWHGDGPGPPLELGQALGAVRAASVAGRGRRLARAAAADNGLDPLAARNLVRLPRRAGARPPAAGPRRPHHRGRALPRRDRRLAGVRAEPLRRPGARPVGHGPAGPAGRAVGGSTSS